MSHEDAALKAKAAEAALHRFGRAVPKSVNLVKGESLMSSENTPKDDSAVNYAFRAAADVVKSDRYSATKPAVSLPMDCVNNIWSGDCALPVVYAPKHSDLLLRLPGKKTEASLESERKWLKRFNCPSAEWLKVENYWKLSRAWFYFITQRTLRRFNRIYVIQPKRLQIKCSPTCLNSLTDYSDCSCLGRNHGMGVIGGLGRFSIVKSFEELREHGVILEVKLLEQTMFTQNVRSHRRPEPPNIVTSSAVSVPTKTVIQNTDPAVPETPKKDHVHFFSESDKRPPIVIPKTYDSHSQVEKPAPVTPETPKAETWPISAREILRAYRGHGVPNLVTLTDAHNNEILVNLDNVNVLHPAAPNYPEGSVYGCILSFGYKGNSVGVRETITEVLAKLIAMLQEK